MFFLATLSGVAFSFLLALFTSSFGGSIWVDFTLKALFVEWVIVLSFALHWLLGLGLPRRRRGERVNALLWSLSGLLSITTLSILVAVSPVFDMVSENHGISAWEFLARNLSATTVLLLALWVLFEFVNMEGKRASDSTSARLRDLQSRMHPHFLFNSLNTIVGLISSQPKAAEEATLDLSDLLRAGLRTEAYHELAEEIDLINRYLRIEELRFGPRLRQQWILANDLPMEIEMPALLIQPLVENAIVHGISRLPEGGTVRITGERISRNRVRFEIVNPVPDDDSRPAESNGMALDNIRQRLALAYEEGARLRTYREEGQFRVELILPIS